MKIVCAWCGAHMKGDPEDPVISHSKCKACSDKDKEEIERRKKEKEEQKKKEEEEKKK